MKRRPRAPAKRIVPFREHVGRGLWAASVAATVAAVATGGALILYGHAHRDDPSAWWAFSGDPASAQEVLGTIATAELTFTGLVFSIMIVALQLASSQFSPRVMRTFLRDRGTHVTLAVFVGTFVYTLTVLQSVRERDASGAPFVPGEAVSIAVVLAVVTLLTFVYFVYHIASSIQVVSIIESVAHETRGAIDRRFPPPVPTDRVGTLTADDLAVVRADALAAVAHRPVATLGAHTPGVLTDVDAEALIDLAIRHDVTIEVLPTWGAYVPTDSPLLRIHGSGLPDTAGSLHRHVAIAKERTMSQDVEFGFRQLVDIAARAASPAVNDSTTAVQALERIHDLMRRLAVRPFPEGIHRVDGTIRLVLPTPSWDDFVQLSFAEIRSYAEDSLAVARALRAVLEDLVTLASPERQVALYLMLGEWRRTVERGFAEPADRERAGTESARRTIDAAPDSLEL